MKKVISSNPSRIKSSIIVSSKFKNNKNKNQSNFDNSYITIVNNSETEESNKLDKNNFLSNAHNNITKILSGFINDFEEEYNDENYIKKDTLKNIKKIIEKKSKISFADSIINNKNSSNKNIRKVIRRKSKKQHTVKLPPSKFNFTLEQLENDIKDNLNQEKKELKKSFIFHKNDFNDFFNLSIDASHENLLKKENNLNSHRITKPFSKKNIHILKKIMKKIILMLIIIILMIIILILIIMLIIVMILILTFLIIIIIMLLIIMLIMLTLIIIMLIIILIIIIIIKKF